MTVPKSFHRIVPLLIAAALLSGSYNLSAQQPAASSAPATDSDNDGLSDALEQQLLIHFSPHFMIGKNDCSVVPAEFAPATLLPHVIFDNGTIYGQVFPVKTNVGETPAVEIHYYHLWRRDCGGHGHPLDTEHVAVLVQSSGSDIYNATWRATLWYAAAHENTVCDVSQIARASTLHAEDRGATVWISPGKHASYLNETLCRGGCGADRCEAMTPLKTFALINLGEPAHPMNDSLFIASKAWPLLAKMSSSNFPAAPVARLNQLPVTDIAWFNSGRHPAQGVIAHSSAVQQSIAEGGRDSVSAISVARDSTSNALSTAQDSTGNALDSAGDSTGNAFQKSYRHTTHALSSSARHVGKALHITPKVSSPDE